MKFSRNLFNRSRSKVCTYDDGDKAWCRFGHLHRDDGPAIERPEGSAEWWKQGQKIASFNAREGKKTNKPHLKCASSLFSKGQAI